MSLPGDINTAPPPSSFDGDTDFYEESRWAKLKRRLIEEPLIPLGCALTCWALLEATKSIRSGDKYRTNRMFRRRIYAQGFTILAMVLGSAYWENDRAKRKQYDGLVEEKRKKDKQDAWIRELEIRDQEEGELRKAREQLIKGKMAEKQKAEETERKGVLAVEQLTASKDPKANSWESVRSVLERNEDKRAGPIWMAVHGLWQQRRQ